MTVETYLDTKNSVVSRFRIHESDTGSASVQIALLTERIKYLAEHMREHPKDLSTRRSLIILVSRRNKFLKYLKTSDRPVYDSVVEQLGIKKR